MPPKKATGTEILDILDAQITPDESRLIHLTMGIQAAIFRILDNTGITQAELARRMGKAPAEISKWMRNPHNLTLRSIAKLEAALGCELLSVNVPGSIPAETAPPASKPYPLEDTAPNLLAADDNVEYKRKKP